MASISTQFPVIKRERAPGKGKLADGGRPVAEALAPGTEVRIQDDDVAQQLLLDFDFSSDFGPMAGMTRMQRWDRANNAQLNPPAQVRDLLLHYGLDSEWNKPAFRVNRGFRSEL